MAAAYRSARRRRFQPWWLWARMTLGVAAALLLVLLVLSISFDEGPAVRPIPPVSTPATAPVSTTLPGDARP
ncbi:hypothetical protein [Nocardia sp. NPDC050710]|uniref:hypothetical protein n=1 Tax=Nocardia sp. NPDC050710 TaxID=3157220 RepID=UPI0034099794